MVIVDSDIHFGQEFFCSMSGSIHARYSPALRLIFRNKLDLRFGSIADQIATFMRLGLASHKLNECCRKQRNNEPRRTLLVKNRTIELGGTSNRLGKAARRTRSL
jgi:hypothetical protein